MVASQSRPSWYSRVMVSGPSDPCAAGSETVEKADEPKKLYPADYYALEYQLKRQLLGLFRENYDPERLPLWPHRERRITRPGMTLHQMRVGAQIALRELLGQP